MTSTRNSASPLPPRVPADRIRRLLAGGDTLVLLTGPGPDGLAVLRFRAAIWGVGLERYLARAKCRPGHAWVGPGPGTHGTGPAPGPQPQRDTMDIGVDEPDLAARRMYETLGFTNRAGEATARSSFGYERKL
jgi:hypothetical protein